MFKHGELKVNKLIALLLLTAAIGPAQTIIGSIVGSVKDPSKLAVSGIDVALTSSGASRSPLATYSISSVMMPLRA